MPIVTKYSCDNPNCDMEEPTETSTRAPYTWVKTTSTVEGPGHRVTVITCSFDCVGPAVKKAYKEYMQ